MTTEWSMAYVDNDHDKAATRKSEYKNVDGDKYKIRKKNGIEYDMS